MKAVLVIGDSNSIFIKQYIEAVLCRDGHRVVLIQEAFLNDEYKKVYEEDGVKIEPFGRKRIVNRIPLIRSIIGSYSWCKEIVKKYGYFDVVHIHGVNRFRGQIELCMRKHTGNVIVSVWGDELLRSDKKKLRKFEKYYRIADHITMSTEYMRTKFSEAYHSKFDNKVSTNRFGLSVFDHIDRVKLTETREQLCNWLGVSDSGKIIVLVGHNGRMAQRHIELTEVITRLPEDIQKRMVAVYTLTYGNRTSEYNQSLNREMQKLKCQYIILQNYMNEYDCARLRCIADILLHAQKTDGFSASVQECLYSGGIVFNGRWLQYNELNDNDVLLVEYDSFEQLAGLLPDYIENYDNKRASFADNKSKLRALSSQEATTIEWQKLL